MRGRVLEILLTVGVCLCPPAAVSASPGLLSIAREGLGDAAAGASAQISNARALQEGSHLGGGIGDAVNLTPRLPSVYEGGATVAISIEGNLRNATLDHEFVECGGSSHYGGVWYRLVVPTLNLERPVEVSVDTCTGTLIDTVMGALSGSDCATDSSSCQCVGWNDDFDGCGYQSRVSFPGEAGREVFVIVRPFSTADEGGDFNLTVTLAEACEVPVDLSSLNSVKLHPLHSRTSVESLLIGIGSLRVPVQCSGELACAYWSSGSQIWMWADASNCATRLQCDQGELGVVASHINLTCSETCEVPVSLSALNSSKLHPLLSRSTNEPLAVGIGSRRVSLQCPEEMDCAYWSPNSERWVSAGTWECVTSLRCVEGHLSVASNTNLTCSEKCDVPVDLAGLNSSQLHPLHSRRFDDPLAVGIGSQRVSLVCPFEMHCAYWSSSSERWMSAASWGCETSLQCEEGELRVATDRNVTCLEKCDVPVVLSGLNSSLLHPLHTRRSTEPLAVGLSSQRVALQCPEEMDCAYWSSNSESWISAGSWRCATSLQCEGGELRVASNTRVTCLEKCDVPTDLSGVNSSQIHPLHSRRYNNSLAVGLGSRSVSLQCPEDLACAYWSSSSGSWMSAGSWDCVTSLHCMNGELSVASSTNLTCSEKCDVPVDLSGVNSSLLHPLHTRSYGDSLAVGIGSQRVSLQCPEDLACAYRSSGSGGMWMSAGSWGCETSLQCQEGELRVASTTNLTCSETCDVPVDFSGLNSSLLHPLHSRRSSEALAVGIGSQRVALECPRGYACAYWSSLSEKWLSASSWSCETSLQCEEGELRVTTNSKVTCLEACEFPEDPSHHTRNSNSNNNTPPINPLLQPRLGEVVTIGLDPKSVGLQCPQDYGCAYWSSVTQSWWPAGPNDCTSTLSCEDRQLASDRNLTCLEACEVPVELSGLNSSTLDPLLFRRSDTAYFLAAGVEPAHFYLQCPEGYTCTTWSTLSREWRPASFSDCATYLQCEDGQLRVAATARWNQLACQPASK